jgi:hypothetical protein
VLIALGIVAVAFAVLGIVVVLATAWYRRRVAHAAGLAGPGAWTAACVDPTDPRAWRVLVIDADGVHLRRTSGRDLRTWPWPTITQASTGPVRSVASAVAHRGLHLGLSDGSSVEFLLPSRSTLRYPPELLADAMRELARYGKA